MLIIKYEKTQIEVNNRDTINYVQVHIKDERGNLVNWDQTTQLEVAAESPVLLLFSAEFNFSTRMYN